jgi:hypothetical protein
MRITNLILTVLFLLARSASPQTAATSQAAATGSISGHILDEYGHVVRAVVNLQFAAPRGAPSATRRAFTGLDGSFAFQRLTAGKYLICAQIP